MVYSQNAMNGMPIVVTLWVRVSIAICSLPPPPFGIFASVIRNWLSVLWSNLTFGNERRTAATPDRFAPRELVPRRRHRCFALDAVTCR